MSLHLSPHRDLALAPETTPGSKKAMSMVISPIIHPEFVSLGGSSRRARDRKVETGDSEGEEDLSCTRALQGA
ncbi:hypothetical protein LTR70_010525 [Exophiala xenobiotica]|uniref:Uncharacterized protein n=1 Tax=Lithohypha guttulata TaxID=1690604 RepID=A0ABR0JTX6_9EURO|nr:hypothetical protein LTR24_010446 [Lithohypha guttulata]KAK5309199.1 hypothetical protein LTR70_010525 [Exophiala xenobiotica]